MASKFTDHILPEGDHASLPAVSTTPEGAVYPCTTHRILYRNDGTAWQVWADLGGEVASGVAFSPTGNLGATDVQAALAELDAEKAATGHTHAADGVQALVAGANIVVDATDPANPIVSASFPGSAATISYAGSTNLVATDVEAALDELDAEKAALTRAINAQTGTTYTLTLADAGTVVTLNNAAAITLTVPLNSAVAFPVGTTIDLAQLGAGQVTIAATGGVTVNADPGLKIAARYGVAALLKIGTDTWIAMGRLAA